MTTWREEFARLSEVERQAMEKWQANGRASNLVYDAKEATNAFLIKYQQHNFPPHDAEIPN